MIDAAMKLQTTSACHARKYVNCFKIDNSMYGATHNFHETERVSKIAFRAVLLCGRNSVLKEVNSPLDNTFPFLGLAVGVVRNS